MQAVSLLLVQEQEQEWPALQRVRLAWQPVASSLEGKAAAWPRTRVAPHQALLLSAGPMRSHDPRVQLLWACYRQIAEKE